MPMPSKAGALSRSSNNSQANAAVNTGMPIWNTLVRSGPKRDTAS